MLTKTDRVRPDALADTVQRVRDVALGHRVCFPHPFAVTVRAPRGDANASGVPQLRCFIVELCAAAERGNASAVPGDAPTGTETDAPVAV